MKRSPRTKALGRCLVAVAALASVLVTSQGASAVLNGSRFSYYSGNGTLNGTPVYGSMSDIYYILIAPSVGACTVFSTTMATEGGNQVQAGVFQCNGVNGLSGCAPAGTPQKFVELYNGGTYTCYAHGTVQGGPSNVVQYKVQYDGSYWWYGYINGLAYEATHSLVLADSRAFTWAEHSRLPGYSGCPISAAGQFNNMLWRNSAGVWNYVYPGSPYADGTSSCWSAYGQTGVGGWYASSP
jgi:hypothetical protein